MEIRVRFEPTNNSFASCSLKPLEYATIGKAVGMSNNTVRKYVQELEERGLIVTERTSIITQDGRKQNGSLLYTILPIQFSIDQFYQRQLDAVDRAKERQRVARRMEQTSV